MPAPCPTFFSSFKEASVVDARRKLFLFVGAAGVIYSSTTASMCKHGAEAVTWCDVMNEQGNAVVGEVVQQMNDDARRANNKRSAIRKQQKTKIATGTGNRHRRHHSHNGSRSVYNTTASVLVARGLSEAG
jgi:hypothetical protein